MLFTDLFIKKPVLSIVLSLILLLLGLKAYSLVPLRQFPKSEPVVVSINTVYIGASAALMETFVTTPIEKSLSGIDGIDFIHSQSDAGSSVITLQFRFGQNVSQALSAVSNAVNSARGNMPLDIQPPIITTQDPDAKPLMAIAVTSPTLPETQLDNYVNQVIVPQFKLISGASNVALMKDATFAMRISLDPEKMAAFNISPADVKTALQANNFHSPSGTLLNDNVSSNILLHADLTNAQQFNNLIIKFLNNYPVRIKDIGNAYLGAEDLDTGLFIDGSKNAAAVSIAGESTANPLNIAQAVYQLLPTLESQIPAGMKLKVLYDATQFIRISLNNVKETIIGSIIFVVAVIFLFLGSIRSIFIPVVTIPLSVISVFTAVWLLGFTLNSLTLLAIVLAIGLVVDDAIVVLENIYRHIELGKTPLEASILGAREIRFAIIAMTLTLSAVYLPVGFIPTMLGQLFREFAFTLAFAVILSGFFALTLSPMMCSKIIRPVLNPSRFSQRIDQFFYGLTLQYKKLLSRTLDYPKIIVLITVIMYSIGILLYRVLPSELAPSEDMGLFQVIGLTPNSATYTYVLPYVKQMEKILQQTPSLEHYGIMANSQMVYGIVELKPWNERSISMDQAIQYLAPPLSKIPGLTIFPVPMQVLPGIRASKTASGSFELILKTEKSYSELAKDADQLIAELKQNNPAFINLQSDLHINTMQTDITINRNLANILGISLATLANTISGAFSGANIGYFEMNGTNYNVIPEFPQKFLGSETQLNNLRVPTANGAYVPISSIIQLSQSLQPPSLSHFQSQRSATISSGLAPGYSLGQAVDYIQKNAKQLLPPGDQYDFGGATRSLIESNQGSAEIFLLAVLFIFLILAAQFESFRDPLVILISVPLSLTGALLTLFLTKGSLNIYTQIGLVTLIGLITKHGILIVEFANQIFKSQVVSLKAAVLEASSLRLRPILMTTAAMVCGAIPMIISSGPGSHAGSELGWVIVGGMCVGTLFTLFILPVIFTLLSHHRNNSPPSHSYENYLITHHSQSLPKSTSTYTQSG